MQAVAGAIQEGRGAPRRGVQGRRPGVECFRGLESIEQDAWRRLAEIMPPELARGIGFECEPMGEALLMMVARISAFQFNWLGGAG